MNDASASALDRLAELAGIEPRYWDIWGTLHEASEETKRSLLAAMGLPAADDAEVAESTAVLEQQAWQHPLPPVMVLRHDTAAAIAITLPASESANTQVLEISEEGGTTHSIEFVPADLPLVEDRTIDRRRMERRLLTLHAPLPIGYHRCRMAGGNNRVLSLIVTPEQCYLPPCLQDDARRWGIATHLYTLRSARDWGIGDFGSLQQLVDVSAQLGAATIGVNPLHALFPTDAGKVSPYSPSSRQFLNPLYIDVEAASGFEHCCNNREVAACRSDANTDAAFVGYADVAARKMKALAAVHACFRQHLRSSRDAPAADEAYLAFRQDGGERLHRFAVFETLSEHFRGQPWQLWPAPFQDPRSPDVAAFAREHEDRVDFHIYLQFETDRQLAAVHNRALTAGLEIGLYQDLAVGVDPSGADAWSEQGVVVNQASVGCPPDPFNMLGQDWGTPPLNPVAIAERGFEPFIAMLRASMRHAGALRIDHAMGLMHLFWIPAGKRPADGAYVQYRFEDLLGILALESHRNKCLVIGEDLGTVPDGFRERMAAANVLSYRLLYFEKLGDAFKLPEAYPALALACVTTHDLSTLSGFWVGADIKLKHELELYPSAAVEESEWSARANDRRMLSEALAKTGLLPKGGGGGGGGDNGSGGRQLSVDMAAAVHAYLSRSPAKLMMVQIDDITGEADQINLPGTVDQYPNWRRRLSIPVQDIAATPVMRALKPALKNRSARPA